MKPIDDYLAQLTFELKVSRRAKERILAETEDHLRERAERQEARGVSRVVAENDAIKSFGRAKKVADDFIVEQATQAARHAFSRGSLSTMIVFLCVAVTASGIAADLRPGLSTSLVALITVFLFVALISPLTWPLYLSVRRRRVGVMKARDCMAMSYGALGSVSMAILYASNSTDVLGLPASAVFGSSIIGALIALRPVVEAIRMAYETRILERASVLAAYRQGQQSMAKAPIGLFELMLEPVRRVAYVSATSTVRRASVAAMASLALVYAAGWSEMAGVFDPSIGGNVGQALSILSLSLLIGCAASLHRNTGVATMPIAELHWVPASAVLCVICAAGICAGMIKSGVTAIELMVLVAAMGCAVFSIVEATRGIALTRRIRQQEALDEPALSSAEWLIRWYERASPATYSPDHRSGPAHPETVAPRR